MTIKCSLEGEELRLNLLEYVTDSSQSQQLACSKPVQYQTRQFQLNREAIYENHFHCIY